MNFTKQIDEYKIEITLNKSDSSSPDENDSLDIKILNNTNFDEYNINFFIETAKKKNLRFVDFQFEFQGAHIVS